MPPRRPPRPSALRASSGIPPYTAVLAAGIALAGCATRPAAPLPGGSGGGPARATDSASGAVAPNALPNGSPGAPPAAGPSTVYACPDGFRFSVRLKGDSAVVALPARTATLPQTVAASGTRYAADGLVFWSKGARARLETADAARDACVGRRAATPWDEARLLGVEFRAIGQEPAWVLDVDQGHTLRYVGDVGRTRVVTPAPPPRRGEGAAAVLYHARTAAHDLAVVIREASCQDEMSGERFTHAVTLSVDGRELRGCGRVLGSGDLIDTYWRLTELAGRPAAVEVTAPDGREAHIRLLAADGTGRPRVAGSTGCNNVAGRYARAGDGLHFSRLVTTRMACVDPLLTRQERAFVRALAATDRAAVAGDVLTLYARDRPVARFGAVYLR